MSQQIDKHLIKAIVDTAIWLEFSNSNVIDPDAAVQAMEQLASELQLMHEESKIIFIRQLTDLAKEYLGEKAVFVNGLAETFGLVS